MKEVKSSNIKSIGYDSNTKTLTIEFNTGSIYDYHEVNPEEHELLLNAKYIGGHFHQHIRPKKFTKHAKKD